MPGLKGPAYTPLRGAKAAKAAYYHRATLVANDKAKGPGLDAASRREGA